MGWMRCLPHRHGLHCGSSWRPRSPLLSICLSPCTDSNAALWRPAFAAYLLQRCRPTCVAAPVPHPTFDPQTPGSPHAAMCGRRQLFNERLRAARSVALVQVTCVGLSVGVRRVCLGALAAQELPEREGWPVRATSANIDLHSVCRGVR